MSEVHSNSMLAVGDAASYVALSESTLNKLRLTGGGPKYSKLGRCVRYRTTDLDTWLDRHRRSSTSVAA